MKPIFGIAVFVLCAYFSLIYAQSPPEVSAEYDPVREFLDAVPHRLELPEDELKTYLIDGKTFEIRRSFDGWLRDYWSDLDIVLTESEYSVYYVNGEETDTKPEGKNIFTQDIDNNERTIVTLWNRLTGEKIRSVTCDRAFSGGDDSPLRIVHRKALLWNAKTWTTGVVDLVTGESQDTLPGYVQYVSKDGSFLILQEKNDISIRDAKTFTPYCTVPGRTVRLSKNLSRFITWKKHSDDAAVYELKTGNQINSFPKGDTAELNHDGTKLLIRNLSPAKINLWDVDTGQNLWSIPFGGKDEDHYTFEFSEDGRIITGDCNMLLPDIPDDFPRTYVWNARTGKEIAMFDFFFASHYFGKVNRMFGSISLGDFESEYVLCDATTGEVIAGGFTGYHHFEAVSEDQKCFLTSKKNTLSLWESETGKPLRTIEDESIILHRTDIAFDSDPARIRTTTPIPQMDSCFTAQETLFDIDTGKIVKQGNILPTDTRFDDTVWKTDENNAVFWNLETGRAFFTIRLLHSKEKFGPNIIGPIHFTADGNELIYSTKMRPWEERVDF